MSYEKQTWVTGEIVTADKLNHMEDGIADAGGVSGLCSFDGSSLDKSYNELMAILNAGVLPFFIIDSGGIAYLSDIGSESSEYWTTFANAVAEISVSFYSVDADDPMPKD